jgi:hypothetical protein
VKPQFLTSLREFQAMTRTAARAPYDQLRKVLGLELRDSLRERRLRDLEVLSSPREVSPAGEHQEELKVAKVHAPNDKRRL